MGVQELSQGSDLCIGLILAEQAGRQEGRQTGETLENGLPQLSTSNQHLASATRTGKCYQSPTAQSELPQCYENRLTPAMVGSEVTWLVY